MYINFKNDDFYVRPVYLSVQKIVLIILSILFPHSVVVDYNIQFFCTFFKFSLGQLKYHKTRYQRITVWSSSGSNKYDNIDGPVQIYITTREQKVER